MTDSLPTAHIRVRAHTTRKCPSSTETVNTAIKFIVSIVISHGLTAKYDLN